MTLHVYTEISAGRTFHRTAVRIRLVLFSSRAAGVDMHLVSRSKPADANLNTIGTLARCHFVAAVAKLQQ